MSRAVVVRRHPWALPCHHPDESVVWVGAEVTGEPFHQVTLETPLTTPQDGRWWNEKLRPFCAPDCVFEYPTGLESCDICGVTFAPYEEMRRGGDTRRATYLCKPHQDEFDSIDWGAHNA